MLRYLLLVVALIFTQLPQPDDPDSLDRVNLPADQWDAGVEAFVLLIDGSTTMSRSILHQDFIWVPKIDIATGLAEDIVDGLPEEDYQGGVRAYGQCDRAEPTSLLSGMDRFRRAAVRRAVDSIDCADGKGRLATALDSVRDDLEGTRPSAVILITDGKRTGDDEVEAARRLHQSTGACIHAIQVGTDQHARRQLEKIVTTGGDCGSLLNARDLAGDALQNFVAAALLAPAGRGR